MCKNSHTQHKCCENLVRNPCWRVVMTSYVFMYVCIGWAIYRFKFKPSVISNRAILMAFNSYIIGHYKSSVRIIDLVSHTTYVVYVNFYTWVAGPIIPNDRFLRNIFKAILFYSKIVCQKSTGKPISFGFRYLP